MYLGYVSQNNSDSDLYKKFGHGFNLATWYQGSESACTGF